MIKFSKNIIRSFIDLPNKSSMMIHSIGCNLKCYQCFNYEALVHNPLDICDEEYILNQIELNGFLFDAIIISGGEFLMNDIDNIITFIKNVRKVFQKIIIINTNGTFPDKIKSLYKLDIIDGFHTDMKLPYHLLNTDEDDELIKEIIGKTLSITDIGNILLSIENTVKYDKGYSQIRSVKYPMLDDSAFKENKTLIKNLNIKYSKNVKYIVNEFVKGVN